MQRQYYSHAYAIKLNNRFKTYECSVCISLQVYKFNIKETATTNCKRTSNIYKNRGKLAEVGQNVILRVTKWRIQLNDLNFVQNCILVCFYSC